MDTTENTDSKENIENKQDTPTSQPSAALALNALLDNTQEELKPIVGPILTNLPDQVIIGMATTLLPDVNINISLIDPSSQLEIVNLNNATKNEIKANKILNNPNIKDLTPTNILKGIGGTLSTATQKIGNTVGVIGKKTSETISKIKDNKVVQEVSKEIKKEMKQIISSIKSIKNKTLNKLKSNRVKLKLKSRKNIINKKILNDTIEESKSFFADKKLNDKNSINNRIKSLISYKDIKASLVKNDIISYLNKKKITNIEKLVKNIINDRNNIIKSKRYLNAKVFAEDMINVYKSNKNSIDEKISNITKDNNIRLHIIDSLKFKNLDELIDIIYEELKKTEVIDKMQDHKKIAYDLINFFTKNEYSRAMGLIENIVNFVSANDYSKQINDALNNNEERSLFDIIYQILYEKQMDQDNMIKKTGRKLGIKVTDENIDEIKTAIIIGTPIGAGSIIAKKLLESNEGKIIFNQLRKESVTLVNDVKSTLGKLSSTPEYKETKDAVKSTLSDIKNGNLKGLVKDVIALNNAKNAIEKKLIISTAAKLGIHISDKDYTIIKMAIGMTTPTGIAKTLIIELSKTKTGRRIINAIKKKGKSLLHRNNANNAENATIDSKLELEKARVDAAISGNKDDKYKIKLLEQRIKELEIITDLLKKNAINSQSVEESKDLVKAAENNYKEAQINYEKVKNIVDVTNTDVNIKKTLEQALQISLDQRNKALETLSYVKLHLEEKIRLSSESNRKVNEKLENNRTLKNIVNKTNDIKNKIISTPELVDAKDSVKSAFGNIKRGNIKGLIADVNKLNKAKAALEKKLIVGTAAKLGITISDKNYDRLRMAMASTTPMGAAKTLVTVFAKSETGRKLISRIKQKASNAVKHNKANDAQINANFLRDEAERLRQEAKNSKDIADKVAANKAIKDALEAAKAASILRENAIASSSVTETSTLVEVAQMKRDEVQRNIINLNIQLNNTKDPLQRALIQGRILIANNELNKANNTISDAQKIADNIRLNSYKSANKVTNYLQDKPQIQYEINKIGETKESAKKAIDALRSGDKKEIISSVKDLMQKKTELTNGAYKAVGSAVGLNLSDQDVKQIQKAEKAAKAAAKAAKAASKMKSLMKGPAAFIIAIIAIILEKTLKLDEDDFGKCNPGDFDLNSIPSWAKKVIDMMPGLGEIFDLIGNKLCIKQGCPEHKPENTSGLCYPRCNTSFKSDGAMICWKQYPDFENNGQGHTITSITKKITTNTGTIPDRCGPGEDKNGALCYPACRPGYDGVGPVCWERCKEGTVDTGIRCEKTSYGRGAGRVPDRTPCPGGFRTDPVTCWKDLSCNTRWDGCCSRSWPGVCWGCARTNCSGPELRGRDPICRPDEDLVGLLCYPKCRRGYVGNGPVCWRNINPYTKQSYGRGSGNSMKCSEDLFNVSGLCYRRCPPGSSMKSLGLCSQECPPGSTDFGVGCTRESYNRGVGDVPFNVSMKPRKKEGERFTDISHMIEYYNVEHFSNYDNSLSSETKIEHFENNQSFLEEFYNINDIIKTLERYNNHSIEGFNNTIEINDSSNYGINEAFNNLKIFNIQNGDGFEELSYLDNNTKDQVCKNGFCGISSFTSYSQYPSNECIDELKINRESSVKSRSSISSSVYSIDSEVSQSIVKKLTPKTGTTPKAKPFIRQAIKTLAKSFPVSKEDQVRLARRGLRLVKDVKDVMRDKDIKPLAKSIMKQIALDPPTIIIKPRLEDKLYELDI